MSAELDPHPESVARSVTPPAEKRKKKVAVVLTGGGANGAFEIGVLKALVHGRVRALDFQKVEPTIFCGTSVGAFNAAFLAADWGPHGLGAVSNLERLWLEDLPQTLGTCHNGIFRIRGNPLEFLNPRCWFPNPLRQARRAFDDSVFLTNDLLNRFFHLIEPTSESFVQRAAELFNLSSFVSTEPLADLLPTVIDFEAIRACTTRELRIIATNWARGEIREFSNVDMTEQLGPQSILSSVAVPGFFPVYQVGAEPHVDGGVLMNTPLQPAIDAGADEIHCIYLDPDISSIPLSHLENALGTLYRMQQIWWASRLNQDIEKAAAINEGIEVVKRARQGEEIGAEFSREIVEAVVATGMQSLRRYRPLTIYRYHPRSDLGGGAAGILDFSRDRIEDLIERGFRTAESHRSIPSGDVLPGKTTLRQVENASGGVFDTWSSKEGFRSQIDPRTASADSSQGA